MRPGDGSTGSVRRARRNPRLDIVSFYEHRWVGQSKFTPQAARESQRENVIDVEKCDTALTQEADETGRRAAA